MHTTEQTEFFTSAPAAGRPWRTTLWTSRVLGTLAVLFLVFDSIGKLLELQPVVTGSAQLGYPPETMFPIGAILLACVAVYVFPPTSVLGAVLLTGYLGGAVATHVRVGNPLLTHTLFPMYVGVIIWGALLVRDARLRMRFPWRVRETVSESKGERPH